MINTQDEFTRASGKYTVEPPRDSQGNEDGVHPTTSQGDISKDERYLTNLTGTNELSTNTVQPQETYEKLSTLSSNEYQELGGNRYIWRKWRKRRGEC